ncbi:Hypothetical predicted protein [Olea europaea subsp. europaea]|uniref:Myb/SANT-like domain-containing protein n=1 Tax=Olea europaea subsp. europaea TaxID=158383 RepID=A0A8S0SLR7_OLEEU|nr:Hypothetical predicted protein [Olea europaea subsp. europaea]
MAYDAGGFGYYTETMNYTTQNPDSMPVPTANPNMENRPEPRKCARWEPREQKIFMSAAEHVTAEGHRRGKCFSSTGDHKLLFELLQSTGIACGLSTGGRVNAPEWWWTQKIMENPRYGKFKDNDNTEIYHKYSRLFGGSCDSMKYALTPTKLSQRGFALGGNSDFDDPHDTLPINVETTDSSDGPTQGRASSSMNISRERSGEKRKGKHAKGKRKKFGAREVSESVDNLACASREMASVIRAKEEGRMTLHECIDDLLSTGLVEAGDELHMFALWFLRSSENRVAYSAAKTAEMRYKWIAYCFERDKRPGSGSR